MGAVLGPDPRAAGAALRRGGGDDRGEEDKGGGAAFLGLCTSRVWVYAFFISLLAPLPLPASAGAFEGLPSTSVVYFLSAAALALTAAAAAPRIEAAFARRAPALVAVVGTAAALALLASDALGAGGALGCAPAAVATVLGGCTLALIRLAWGQLYGTLDLRDAGLYTASSFLIATAVNVVLKLLPWGFTAAVLVALPCACAVLVRRAGRAAAPRCGNAAAGETDGGQGTAGPGGPGDGADELTEEPSQNGRAATTAGPAEGGGSSSVAVAQLAMGMFVFVFANCIMRAFMPGGLGQGWTSGWASLAVDAVVALLFFGLYAVNRGINTQPAYRCTLILMVAGYTLCTLVPADRQAVTMSLVLIGYGLFDLLSWVAMTRVAARVRTCTLRVFALGVGMTVAGRALGYVVGAMCLARQSAGAPSLQSVSMLMVFLLVVVCFSILPESLFARPDRPGSGGAGGGSDGLAAIPAPASPSADAPARPVASPLDAACAALATSGGLTARESDIFALLARGHSAQVISGELSIAKGTVQTHVKHIYAKLGLHNQQELIELVERTASGGMG